MISASSGGSKQGLGRESEGGSTAEMLCTHTDRPGEAGSTPTRADNRDSDRSDVLKRAFSDLLGSARRSCYEIRVLNLRVRGVGPRARAVPLACSPLRRSVDSTKTRGQTTAKSRTTLHFPSHVFVLQPASENASGPYLAPRINHSVHCARQTQPQFLRSWAVPVGTRKSRQLVTTSTSLLLSRCLEEL